MALTGVNFHFVCAPSALHGSPSGWARQMLREGEIALLGNEGLDAIDALAHELDQVSIAVVRDEHTPELQDATVIALADQMPIVWVAPDFSDRVRSWARERGPMSLLVQRDGALDDDERRRIDRFVALLGRQSE